MRKLLTPRRSLLGASIFLLAASSLALLLPGGASASAARRNDAIVKYYYFTDAAKTTYAGTCVYNYRCMGYDRCSGTATPYYTVVVDECP